MRLEINPNFANLIQPLQEEEFEKLTDSIIAEGCRDAIVAWNNTILDGHNRYKICQEHSIEFEVLHMDFDSSEDAMLWMINNQQGRRNLSKANRGKLALKKKSIVAELAKEKERSRKSKNDFDNIVKVNTREELAKEAGVSEGTLSKIEIIEEHGTNDLKKMYCRTDSDVSINVADKVAKMENPDQEMFVHRVNAGEKASSVCSDIQYKNMPKLNPKQLDGNFEKLARKCLSFAEGLQFFADGTMIPQNQDEANEAKTVLNSAPNIIMQFVRLGVDVEWCIRIAKGDCHGTCLKLGDTD